MCRPLALPLASSSGAASSSPPPPPPATHRRLAGALRLALPSSSSSSPSAATLPSATPAAQISSHEDLVPHSVSGYLTSQHLPLVVGLGAGGRSACGGTAAASVARAAARRRGARATRRRHGARCTRGTEPRCRRPLASWRLREPATPLVCCRCCTCIHTRTGCCLPFLPHHRI